MGYSFHCPQSTKTGSPMTASFFISSPISTAFIYLFRQPRPTNKSCETRKRRSASTTAPPDGRRARSQRRIKYRRFLKYHIFENMWYFCCIISSCPTIKGFSQRTTASCALQKPSNWACLSMLFMKWSKRANLSAKHRAFTA